MTEQRWTRRALMSGLGASAMGLSAARPGWAQETTRQGTAAGFHPARHAQDAWFDTLPGRHRTVIDTLSSRGVGEALLFARNLFVANGSGYQLKDADVAVVITLRHAATAFAFNDAMWAKYGASLAAREKFVDPKTNAAPTANLYNTAGFGNGITISAVVERGTHFAVCAMATQFLSGIVAKAAGITPDAAFKELAANLVPNSHLMAAGVVATTRAQEYGYSLLHAG